jgi:hypothetical protein
MANGWGGWRRGAGRKPRDPAPIATGPLAEREAVTPLQYLTRVLHDATASPTRRDMAARTLLAYQARLAPGKKERAMMDALTAGRGTPWEGLLEFHGGLSPEGTKRPTMYDDAEG